MSYHILMANEFFSMGDGSSLYIDKVSRALIERGHRVSALYGTMRNREIENPAIKRHYVPGIFGFNYVNTNAGLQKTRRAVEDANPDIIYMHQVLNPHVVSLLADLRPAIRYEHGFRLACPTGRRDVKTKDRICEYPFSYKCMFRAHTQHCMPRNPFLALRRIRDVYRNIAAHKKLAKIIVASEYIRDLLKMSGFDSALIEKIPYFVDLPPERPDDRRHDKPMVLFVGRMGHEKGPEFLMQALKLVGTPVRAVFAGEGPELNKLRSMSRNQSRHSVEFPGWVDNERLAEYYRQANVLVVPSVWPEPFGIIGIEAMSYSVPVVAFDVGGISEWLVDGSTGFLVERKNTDQLAEKITILLGNTSIANAMGIQGRSDMISRFTLDKHMEKLESVFDEAIDQSSGAKAPNGN